MTEPIHDTSDPYIVDLLNITCADFGDNTYGNDAYKGYAAYRVETHCVAVTYIAKAIDRDHNGMPTRYSIIHRDYEAR